jgi:F-type H+-transporting ATPase subunit epsilon
MKHPIPTSTQLTVTARGPFELYYEGLASAVTALNKVGQFDVLPGHADFFSMLTPGEVTIETAAEPVTFMITNGIITVRDNEVLLFVNM